MAGLRRLRLLLASIGILAVGFGTAIAATFDGAPATPTPVKDTAAYSDLDVQVHSRDSSTWYALETQNAQHGQRQRDSDGGLSPRAKRCPSALAGTGASEPGANLVRSKG